MLASPLKAAQLLTVYIYCFNSEKYSRGRRGAPAKGVGRDTGARVQIPPSPLEDLKNFKIFKKVLDVTKK